MAYLGSQIRVSKAWPLAFVCYHCMGLEEGGKWTRSSSETQCLHSLAFHVGLLALIGVVGTGEKADRPWTGQEEGGEDRDRKGRWTCNWKSKRSKPAKAGWDAREGSQSFQAPLRLRGVLDDFNLYRSWRLFVSWYPSSIWLQRRVEIV